MANPIDLSQLEQYNDMLLTQLETTRLNAEEMREMVSIFKRLTTLGKIDYEQALKINQINRNLANLNKSIVDQTSLRNKLERNTTVIQKDITKNLELQVSIGKELELLDKQRKGLRGQDRRQITDLINSLEQQLDTTRAINDSLSHELDLTNKLEGRLGIIPITLNNIDGILKRLGLNDLSKSLNLSSISDNLKKFIIENQGNVNLFQRLFFTTKEIGKNIWNFITPSRLLDATLLGIFKTLISLDKSIGSTASNLGISYKNATKLNNELHGIAASSKNIFHTTENLTKSYNELANSIESTVISDKNLLLTHTKLVEQIGLSSKSANTLAKIQAYSGISANKITKTYLGQIKALNLQNKTSLNSKKILDDISNISKATLLTLSSQPEQLAKAAYEAKKIGIELSKLEGIQKGLLDIESSIANEFEAEILTGRALNLERARYFALTNDIAGLSKEINNQGIDAISFGKMNYLQQESIAKAIGLSRDALGDMLFEQQALNKLGYSDNEEGRKKLQLLQQQGFSLKSLTELGGEELEQLEQSVSAQQRFEQSVNKLKEIFVSLSQPLIPVIDLLAKSSDIVAGIAGTFLTIKTLTLAISGSMKILNALSTIQSTIALTTLSSESGRNKLIAARQALLGGELAKSIGIAAAWAMANPVMAIAGVVAAGVAAAALWNLSKPKKTQNTEDGIIDSDGGLVVSGKKGSINLHPDDQIIAGTNLFDKSKSNIKPNNDNSLSTLSITLSNKLDLMINKLDTLIKTTDKGLIVNLDGVKVSRELSTPLYMVNRNI